MKQNFRDTFSTPVHTETSEYSASRCFENLTGAVVLPDKVYSSCKPLGESVHTDNKNVQ